MIPGRGVDGATRLVDAKRPGKIRAFFILATFLCRSVF